MPWLGIPDIDAKGDHRRQGATKPRNDAHKSKRRGEKRERAQGDCEESPYAAGRKRDKRRRIRDQQDHNAGVLDRIVHLEFSSGLV